MSKILPSLGLALLVGAAAPLANATATQPAEDVVRSTTDRVLAEIKRDSTLARDLERLYSLVDALILPHFDFARMSQRVLGKYWRQANEDQRARFVAEFQTLLVRTYATALAEYRDQVINYLPTRMPDDATKVNVRTEVVQSGSPPIPIDYRMYLKDDGWKVYDVAIDGVSLVINYRSTFSSEIKQKGMDGLIERLVTHNQKLGASQ